MAALGAATLLDEEAELAARSKIQGIADAIKPKGGDQDDLSYKIGSVFGSIAGFAAPIAGIAAGIGAAPISIGAAATTGIATGAGALLGVGTAAGEASERARAAGATQEERNRAIRQAAPFGLLEVAPLGRFMRSVDVPVINRLMDQLGPEVVETMGQRISNAAVTGGAEAAQEATAEIVQNLAERGYNPERAILEGTGESAALGGGAGATIQFLVDAFTNSRKAGVDGPPQEVTPEAAPEGGIAGLLPSPAAVQRSVGPQAVAKFRSWEDANPEEAARLTDAERTAKIKQYYDELSVKQPESRYIPKGLQLTGPDDLGIRLDSGEGQAVTREQSIAAREKAADVVKRARAEIRSTGEVSSETFGKLREATRTGAIPFEETASILENTRFEPALDLIEGTDLPAGVAAPEVKTQPVQDKARFDAAVANAKSGIGALAGRESALAQDAARERAKQAALERDDVDAFEQPDLFALELEQARRDPRGRALQNIPTPEPEVTPQPTTEQERELLQRDLFNAAQVGTQDASANIRRAREVERQKQEDIDVDTELGLREMQARVTEPKRRQEDRERPEQLSFRGDLRQPKTITRSTLTMKDAGEPLDARPVDTATSGVGVPPVGPSGADRPTEATPSAPDATTPDGRGVGRTVRGAGRADASTEPQPTTLTGRERQGPDRPTGQVIPGTKYEVDPKTLKRTGKTTFVKDPTLAPKPVKETTKQTFATQKADAATKKRAETAKAKEADTTQAAKFAEQDADIQRQGKADSDKDAPAAPMTASDKNKILKLMDAKRTKAKGSQLANAVQKYFNQFPTFTAALDAIIYDVSMQIPNRTRNTQEYKDDPVLAKFYTSDKDKNLPSMGKTSARRITDWLTSKDTGMSADLQNYVKSELQQGSQARAAQANYNAKDRVAEARSRLTPEELAELEIISAKDLQLPAELVIDTPIRPSVKDAINKGNLVDALNALRFTTPSKDIALLSKRLAETLGDTKIVARKNLRAEDGAPVAGYFDPADNTIYLDKDTGFTGHALLHEALHAATSGIIANKSHPLTKKLNRLFEETKEQLADEYGLTTMDEFVAEALSNPEFQTQLKLTTIKGRNPWQQMVRAISNFVRTLLGRSTIPDNSAYQAIDKLVQEMIAVDYDGRAATKMYLKIKTPAGAAQAINELGAKVIKADKNFYDQAKELIGSNTPMLVKKMFLNLQPVNILGQLAESKIPMAPQLNNIINGMSSALRERNERLDPIVADLRKFKKDNLEKFNTLQALVPNATYERIDPRQADFNKAYGRDKNAEGYNEKEARAIHADLHKKWKSLGKEGQNLYAVVTNTFEASTDEVMKSIDENLAATIKDAAIRKKAIDKLAKLLNMDRGVIKPFAPLTRQGNFRLAYNTIDPKTGKVERFVEYFKSERLREKAKRNLKEYNDGVLAKLPQGDKRRAYILKDWEEGTSSTVASFSQAPPDSFVFNVLQTLKANNVDATTIDSIAALALDMMPERSFMQSFRKRGDVRGFLGDKTPTGMAEEAFDLVDMVQNKGRDYNRQIVQMQFGAKIQGFKNELREFAPAEKTSTDVGLFRDKLEQIANFAQRPTVPRWSQVATSAGYGWTMGFNLSSAAITTFDVFMSTAPRLMGKYGDKAAMKAMGSASAILARSPKEKMVQVMGPNGKMTNRKVNTGVAGFSIANYDFDAADLPKELRDIEVLAEVATENAQINQTLNQEQLDMGNTKDVMEKINSWNSFLFHHAERYNREVAMTATYMLELQRMRDKKGSELTVDEKRQAAMTAVTETEFTLGATASAGRPVYAQSGIGNMAMLFKRFAISKYYMMARMTDEAFKTAKTEDDKVNRRIAQKQLGRFLVSTGLFAGVAGMPLMGALGQIYDLFVDDDEDDFDAMLRKTVGEGLYKGVINEALGVEVASRISLNSLLYRPPIIEKDQSQFFTLIEQLGGPIVGIGLSIERGVGLVQEGEILKGTEAILPAAARNIIKGGKQAATGEVETRRGDAVVEDIGAMQILGQFAGFANADVIKTYEVNKNERRKNDHLRTTRTRLLRAANIAAANGDASGYREALKKIRDYNRELPRSARSKNLIMPDTIKKSRRAFDTRTKKMVGGIEYTPFMLRSLDEYDQGIQLFN